MLLASFIPGMLALLAATPPLVVAHRGYSSLAPENTLVAYQYAIEAGAPAAECDVYCTSDGQVVLIHDGTVDRTTDGTGAITAMTLEQVKQLDAGSWKAGKFCGEKIPTLEETLTLTKGRMRLVIEIKQAGIAQAVVDVLHKTEALSDVTIISFSAETCRQVRELEPSLPVGWLTGGCKEDDADEADTIIRTALAANCQFIDVAWPGIKPALLNRAQLAGMAIWAWTVDDPAAMHKLAELGVASITTNDVEAGMGAFAPEE